MQELYRFRYCKNEEATFSEKLNESDFDMCYRLDKNHDS